MPEPQIVVVVVADDHRKDDISKTVASVDGQVYGPIAVSVVGNDSSAKAAVSLNKGGEAASGREGSPAAASMKGRTAAGTPLTVQSIGPRFSLCEALNAALKDAEGVTDLFVLLSAGDELHPDACGAYASAFAENPGTIGAVWSDYRLGLFRRYQEPFSRPKLLTARLHCPTFGCVSRVALRTVGLFDPKAGEACFFDLWVRLSERFMVVHVTDELLRVAKPPETPLDAATAAVERAALRHA